MFSSQLEHTDENCGCYAGQIGRNKLLWAVKVNPPEPDFMKIALLSERTLHLKSARTDILWFHDRHERNFEHICNL